MQNNFSIKTFQRKEVMVHMVVDLNPNLLRDLERVVADCLENHWLSKINEEKWKWRRVETKWKKIKRKENKKADEENCF